MSKVKYEVWLPKSILELESNLVNLFKSKYQNIIIKIFDNYIETEELVALLTKLKKQFTNYKKSSSIVIVTDQYETIPDFISVAPTEEEAVDVIDFEEIERDLLLDE